MDRGLNEPPPSTLEELRAEVEAFARARGRSLGIGIGSGTIRVELSCEEESLARALHERFAERVELTVGAFGYPPGRAGLRRFVGLTRGEEVRIDGLELELRLDERVLRAGDRQSAKLVVSNGSRHHLGPIQSGTTVGRLLDEQGSVVGGFFGWIAASGLILELDPGEERTFSVPLGVASYREELGYVLPPGPYRLFSELFLYGPPGERPKRRVVTSPLVEVTVAARP